MTPKPKFRYQPGWQDNIPAELKARRQIVVWRFCFRFGKWTKVPFCPVPGPDGKYAEAKTNDPSTWGTWDEALAALTDRNGKFDGVGFVFSADDPYCGIDLDKCYNADGSVQEWAKPYLKRLYSYTEISPSGTGVKVFVRGSIPVKRGNKKTKMGPDVTGAIEIYDRVRFFTLTGRIPKDGPREIVDRAEVLAEIHAELFPPVPPTERKPGPPPGPLDLTDQEVLGKAFEARNGHAIASLYAGDIGGYGSHSEADLGLCSRLTFWFQGDPNRMDRVFRQSGLYRDKWDELRGAQTYGEMTIAKALESWDGECYSPKGKRKGKGTGGPSANGTAETNGDGRRRYTAAEAAEINVMLPEGAERVKEGDPCQDQTPIPDGDIPEIEITTKRHQVVAQAIASLPRDPTLYRRCERLVTVVEDTRTRVKITKRTAIRQQEKTPRIVTLSTAVIGMVLTRNGDWFQWKKDPEGEFIAVPAHPPDWAIKAVETIGHWPSVRFLRAVAEAPFIRPDGSVVDVAGYDADTETLFIPSGAFPPIPARPSRDDAKAAARKLFALIEQFPFVDDSHKWVWLAALLSVIGRPAITGPCPGFVFDANVAGTGKTLLATIIGLIATGRDVSTIGYPEDPAEMGKIITSVALAGYPVVLLDNVPNGSKFGNAELDRALTSTLVDGRELGKSRMVGMLDLSSVWLLTGNNVSPTGDSFRRWLPSRIESPLERPDRRGDLTIPDLPEYVREHRGELVAAALTILRAHAEAGWTVGEWTPLGSYTAWDRVVRGAVWFATEGDCCTTQDQFVSEDPERLERSALAEGWLELPGGNTGLTAGEALELVREDEKQARGNRKYETLRTIFLEWGSKGELASTRTIGNRLKAIKGQNLGKMKFVEAGDVKRALKWKVVTVGGESGEPGESGSQANARDLGTDSHVKRCSDNRKTPEESPRQTHQTRQTHQ